ASQHFMSLLAIFFVFDFAINFLSALLRAAREQVYLLEVTAVAAVGFGLLVVALPPVDGERLLALFISAQAAWAVLLLVGIVRRWPGAARQAEVKLVAPCSTGAAPAGDRRPACLPRRGRAGRVPAISRPSGRAR